MPGDATLPATTRAGAGRPGWSGWWALATAAGDVAVVLAFVAIGRGSHHDGESLRGLASTAWPFLAGLAGGWLAVLAGGWLAGPSGGFLPRPSGGFLPRPSGGFLAELAWRSPRSLLPTGVAAWLGAVVIGMALRVVAGQGTKAAFVGVAAAFLGLGLLGWRAVATGLLRARPGGGESLRQGTATSPRSA